MPTVKGKKKSASKPSRIKDGDKTAILQDKTSAPDPAESGEGEKQTDAANKDVDGKNNINWREWIRDIALTMSALASIFLALLVFFGRIYADGYFSALNIPSDQVNFSIVDYAAVGWEPPLFVIFAVSSTLIYFGILLLPYELFLARDILKIVKWGKNQFDKKKKLKRPFPSVSIRLLLLGLAGLGLVILSVVALPYLSKNISGERSQTAAREQLNRSMKLDILSEKPLWGDLTPTSCATTFSGPCFRYQDLYLLTYNNGHYFLFRELGLDCKPKQVYVIKDENVLGIKMNADVHPLLPPECKGGNVSVTPSPIPPTNQGGLTPSATAP